MMSGLMMEMNSDWHTEGFNERHLLFVNAKEFSACQAAPRWLQSVFQVQVNYLKIMATFTITV